MNGENPDTTPQDKVEFNRKCRLDSDDWDQYPRTIYVSRDTATQLNTDLPTVTWYSKEL